MSISNKSICHETSSPSSKCLWIRNELNSSEGHKKCRLRGSQQLTTHWLLALQKFNSAMYSIRRAKRNETRAPTLVLRVVACLWSVVWKTMAYILKLHVESRLTVTSRLLNHTRPQYFHFWEGIWFIMEVGLLILVLVWLFVG